MRGAPSRADRAIRIAVCATTLGAVGLNGGHASATEVRPVDCPGFPFCDYRGQSPGRIHRIRPEDLPPPHATPSADNSPRIVPRPPQAWPQAPRGFKVQIYADHLDKPRLLRTSPAADVFVSESEAGAIKILRGLDSQGRATGTATFAKGLKKPFGLAFYPPGAEPQWLYVGETDAVVRFPYRNGDLKARGPAEKVAELPGGGLLRGGGHWTRDLAFSPDGKTLFVSVGSRSNNDDPDESSAEKLRADVLQLAPTGGAIRVFASGIRNAVGLAIHPRNGGLWASVNERDELGDDLVPDYITHVPEGSFFGWPWFYIGAHQDPRHQGKHPELASKVQVPDVLLQPHFASLELCFYAGVPASAGAAFPAGYRDDIFAAEHGSWNRKKRAGYEVVHVPLGGPEHDRPLEGGYEDFLTGFVTPSGEVWGRPVGVAVAVDGALLVSDDAGNVIWRVSYEAPPTSGAPPR